MKPARVCMIAAACMLLGGHAAGQGFYFESVGSTGGVQKSWYMPGKFKTVGSDEKTTIVRLDKETIYDVNPKQRTYTEATFAELKNMLDAGRSKMDVMMKNRLEGLPPERRKEIEEKMAALRDGQTPDVKYEVVSTSESKDISGYPCSEYIVKRNGKEVETIWATKALGDIDAIHKDMDKLSEKMASAMNSRTGPMAWFKDIPGFPIQNEQHGFTRTVSHVEKRAVSESEFEVPAGYTREEFKGFGETKQAGAK
jgi:hypothetical protein